MAKEDAFKEQGESLLTLASCTNVVLIGGEGSFAPFMTTGDVWFAARAGEPFGAVAHFFLTDRKFWAPSK